MGCLASSNTRYEIEGSRMATYDPTFNSSSTLTVTIPAKFAELDADGSGELDFSEFCTGFGFDRTPLTQKLFDAFDQDSSGNINIVEFIAGLRNWTKFTFNDKIKFTYKIYDLDGSGFVEPAELAECLADTNASWRNQDAMKAVVKKILRYLDKAELHRVRLSDFVTLSKKYPSVLFLPLFGLMERIFTIVQIESSSR